VAGFDRTVCHRLRDFECRDALVTEHRPNLEFAVSRLRDIFREAFGSEWFIRRDVPRTQRETTLFADLD